MESLSEDVPKGKPNNILSSEEPVKELSSKFEYSTRSKNKTNTDKTSENTKYTRGNAIVPPRLKPIPYKSIDIKRNLSNDFVKQNLRTIDGVGTFFNTEDLPTNKRGFKYKPCKPNPDFKSTLYSTTDMHPFNIRPSYFDRSQGILFNEEMNLVTTLHGWRSVRTNVCIREGKYYMEFNIVQANTSKNKAHVRIGLARKEASLEAPVGFDGYGYGLRDVGGQKITLSRPNNFMKNIKDISEVGFHSGDTIGMLIELPSLDKHLDHLQKFVKKREEIQALKAEETAKRRKKAKSKDLDIDISRYNSYGNIVRDQIAIKYKGALYFEQFEYTPTKRMDHLLNPVTVFGEKAILENSRNSNANDDIPTIPDSKIVIFKNGVEVGVLFENLYSFLPLEYYDSNGISSNTQQQQNAIYKNTDDQTLGYYPMLSVFQEGVVGINAGPDFKFPINDPDAKPFADRYGEKVVDEWYWDLMDEIEAEYLDLLESK